MYDSPYYSFIILKRGRTSHLADLLLALAAQASAVGPEQWEVIVIDSERTRSAEAVVDYWASRFPCSLRYYFEPRHNSAHSRNLGVARARGQSIVMLDAALTIPTDFWMRLHACWSNVPSWVGVGSLQRIVVFENNFPSYLREISAHGRPSYRGMPRLPGERVSATAVVFRRDCFEGIARPFNPEFGMLGADDSTFFADAESRGFPTVGLDVCVFEKRGRETGGFGSLLSSHFRLGRCHAVRLRRKLPRVRARVAASAGAALGHIVVTFALAPFRNLGRTVDGAAQAAWRIGEMWGYLAV